MAYEVIYKFHERLENGQYNNSETKELKKNIGSGFDDYPLEKLAALIMGQLARRDIWIVDVEISEFTKKKISFKEPADGKGVIIKGKKFSFGASAELVAEDVETEEEENSIQPHEALMKQKASKPKMAVPQKAKSIMLFSPEEQDLREVKQKGFKFTIGKAYPIYKSEPISLGVQSLTTTDDTGKMITISDKFFVPQPVGVDLIGDAGNGNDIKLNYGTGLSHDPYADSQYSGFGIDQSGIPPELLATPDIRRLR